MSEAPVNNASWAAALLGLCYRAGVRHIFIAPGSRSAALALASAQLRQHSPDITLHTHFDERGLAFYALGVARSLNAPVVVITTSGTAVANLHPAVIEAFEEDLPLWVFSADRPDRLLGCGANQAIDQKQMFGSHVNYCASISLPADRAALLAQIATLQANLVRGPMQINCQFDEPLYEGADIDYGFDIAGELVDLPRPGRGRASQKAAPAIDRQLQTIVVLGSLTPHQAKKLKPWLEQLRCPIVADIGSQYRFRADAGFIPNADLLLMSERGRKLLRSQQLIQLGGRIVSKRINQWLADFDGAYYLLSEQQRGLDPSRRAVQCTLDQDNLPQVRAWSDGFLAELRQASQALADVTHLTLASQWSEAGVCAALTMGLTASTLPSSRLAVRTAVFAGNSLSIRMLDSFGFTGNCTADWYTNRGASGIDGLIATAAGVCWSDIDRVVLVIGDTAFLHDLNSLALLSRLPKPVKIVLLNNRGGKIFGLLPAAATRVYEELFVMPHELHFEQACRQFQIDYCRADSRDQFDRQWDDWISGQGASVIECCLPETMDTLRRNYSTLENCI